MSEDALSSAMTMTLNGCILAAQLGAGGRTEDNYEVADAGPRIIIVQRRFVGL